MRLTSVTPNTHGMSGICASMGRTPSNIPPSKMVLRHFLLYAHSLQVSLDTNPPFSLEHLCPPLPSHLSLCISSPNCSLPSAHHAQTISTLLSGSCSRHIQCSNGSRVHCYASFKDTTHILSYHHPFSPPQLRQVLRSHSPSLATIYQLSEHRHHNILLYFSLQFQRDTSFCQNWC